MADNAVSTLNSLIETLKDGQEGFSTAASKVTDATLKGTFTELAAQRSTMASELQSQVKQLGGDPEKTGSTAAALHRGWINLKTALGAGEKAILNEAERGEDVAVQSYKEAINAKLSPEIASVVQRQFSQIKNAHDRVKSLRDSWK